ncbi:macrophage mannose receptor 1-like isoform X2 [Hemibagrus wyckioides]|nr:macrophage mannose receptor 1-like isoform X2 [Hemibagrus wyckioides]
MTVVLSILLLMALTDAATGLFWRQHIYYDKRSSWIEAQTFCKNNYVDLSIIDTQEEFDSFVGQTSRHTQDSSWIGLTRGKSEREFTQWSDGSALGFSKWKDKEPDNQKEDCVQTTNNEWSNEECEKQFKAFCYSWAPKMIVVQEMMNWEEALVHCRTHYTDLVRLTTEIDHFVVNNRSMEIQTPTFWTSLRFMDGSWYWVNQTSLVSNETSLPSCPARPFRCGARNIIDGVWENRDCEEKMNFICYHDI